MPTKPTKEFIQTIWLSESENKNKLPVSKPILNILFQIYGLFDQKNQPKGNSSSNIKSESTTKPRTQNFTYEDHETWMFV